MKELRRDLHEVGNVLMIAQANIEAMLDGVVELSHERLEAVRDTLVEAAERIKALGTLEEPDGKTE